MSSWDRTGPPRREDDPADDDGHPGELHRGRILARRARDEQWNRPRAQKPAERAPLTIKSTTTAATTSRYQTKME
jgi:hypothetical protein